MLAYIFVRRLITIMTTDCWFKKNENHERKGRRQCAGSGQWADHMMNGTDNFLTLVSVGSTSLNDVKNGESLAEKANVHTS